MSHRPLAWPFVGLNRLLAGQRRAIFPLTADAMLRHARSRLQLNSGDALGLCDPAFRVELDNLMRGLDHDRLTFTGRFIAQTYYRTRVLNHFKIERHLQTHPLTAHTELETPLFVVGCYRTATTRLHNLLSLDPQSYGPRTWELVAPVPVHHDTQKDAARRRAAAGRTFFLNRLMIPDQAPIHNIEVDGPEEDLFLLENDGVSPIACLSFGGLDYGRALHHRDLSHAYLRMRRQHQLIMSCHPGKRLISKCPFHLWHLPALEKAYPDARYIFTHRDPAAALASVCSLSAVTTSKFVEPFDKKALGTFWLQANQEGLVELARFKKKIARRRYIDVTLPELKQGAQETVARIYQHFGLQFSTRHQKAISVFEHQNPKKKYGAHNYRYEEYGLDRDTLRERFGDYYRTFDL